MKIRKAILTGGGRATRLHPITTTINKHLLPLSNKPMIFHAIEKAVEVGIKEIFINTNPGDNSLRESIGDGAHWNIKIEYFEQTGGPQGIAHVVNEAKKFIGNDPFMFYLSDNVFLGSLEEMMNDFYKGNYDCMLALSKVDDPERFGVPVFDENNNLIDVLEKPINPPNNFAVTGLYLYGPKIFFEAFEKINKSDRGEYEISSIHSYFLKNKKKVGCREITGWWKDTGKVSDLIIANKLLMEKMPDKDFINNIEILNKKNFQGNIHIGYGTIVAPDVKIIGPVIIGENCVLKNCEIGPNVSIASGTIIEKTKIDNSIILSNCEFNTDLHISNSIIGKEVKIIKKDLQKSKSLIIGDKTTIEH